MLAFIFMYASFFRKVKAFLGDPELRPIFLTTFFVLLVGATFYHRVEGWSWLNSFYFCVVTLATVGYGDLTPQTEFGRLFTIIYVLVGVSILALFIQTIAADPSRFAGRKDKGKKQEPG